MRTTLALITLLASCSEQGIVPETPEIIVTEPAIEVTPAALYFGDLLPGESASQLFTIQSVGDEALYLGQVEVDGAGTWSVGLVQTGLLEPGGTRDVVVELIADGTEQSAQVLVHSDDPNRPIVPVDLFVGEAGGTLLIAPDPVDFGQTGVGMTLEQDATLTNTGTDPVTVSEIRIDGVFLLTDAPLVPFTLEPGEVETVSMSYTPVALPEVQEGLLWVDSTAVSSNSPVGLTGATDYGALRGRICDPGASDYVAGARVWTDLDTDGDGEADMTSETTTDGDGNFELDKLIAGPITVCAEKGQFETCFDVDMPGGGLFELSEDECLEQGGIEIAVIPGGYDDIGSLLTTLGLSFTVEDAGLFDSTSRMAKYDMIFAGCASGWGEAQASGIRDYIEAGGALYASDLALLNSGAVFPDEYQAVAGDGYTTATAKILDDSMEARVGTDTLTISYETGVIPSVPDNDDDVDSEVLIRATVTGGTRPATTRLVAGSGTAIFTSFHTSATATPEMIELFKEMVLSL